MAIDLEIRKKYPGFTLDVRFATESRRIGILGGSGAGKSMTLRSIAGIHALDEGRILLDGRVLYDSAGRVALKPQMRRVGYLFQNYALFPNMTVRENIIVGMKNRGNENIAGAIPGRASAGGGRGGLRAGKLWLGGGKNEGPGGLGTGGLYPNGLDKNARADELIRKFRLEGLEDRLPSRLSGGQQQRTALARILASEPDAILLDEPFSALDGYLRDQMQRELMATLADYPGTVIMVSHDRDEIYRFSEEILIMSGGKIIRQGPTREVFANPGSRDAAALTGCKNFSRAERLDDHHVRALDWGVDLTFRQVVPKEVKDLGFRAHEFLPVWGGERPDNAVRCRVVSEAMLQFEHNYYIAPETEEPAAEPLSWFAQRERWAELAEKGMPDYLILPEEAVMFLG